MSIKWSRKLPCLCQHSPAPTDFKTAMSDGRLGEMVSNWRRRKGRAEESRVWRWWLGCGGEVEDDIVSFWMEMSK